MATQTIAKLTRSFEGTFECRHCELEVPATVYAKSSGAARGTGEQAVETAMFEAEADGNAVAARTLQFVKCPRCGKKDPTGASYRVQATIGALVVGLAFAGFAYLFVAMRSRGTADAMLTKWASLGGGALFAALMYWMWGRPWRSSEKRTIFHGMPPRR